MSTQADAVLVTSDGSTERVDALARLAAGGGYAALERPTEPGRYIEVQGAGESFVIPLARGVTHVGRGLSADLRLDETSVSRRHAILVSRHNVRVLDDRSANGTFVNGRPVERAELSSGDVLTLGRVLLRYLEISTPVRADG